MNARWPLQNPNSYVFTAMLGLLAGLPALSVDLSAPTLPILPGALGTSETVAGLTLSLFMVGFALGQGSAGMLSDGWGRRPVLLGALTCFAWSGVACTLALSGFALTVSRFVQGCGAGACSVISFAMVQDLFEGDAARAKRSYVATIFTGVPILAPALGSLLIGLAGWRSVHAVLAALGTSLLGITWFFVPESRTATAGTIHPVGQRTTRAYADIPFLRFAVANALSYGVIFVYIASSPIVMVRQMGYSTADFAGVFACTAAALAVGAWTNGRLSHRGVAPAALVNPAFIGSIAAAAALAFASLTRVTWDVMMLPLLMIILFARGFLAPNLQHLAIERRRERAGTASAVVGVSQLLAGAAASATVAAMLPAFGLNAVTISMALLAIAAFAVWCASDG